MSANGCPEHGQWGGARGEDVEEIEGEAEIPAIAGYRVEKQLGRGGFGAVYAARPERGGPAVAIKLARDDMPDAAIRMAREIEAISAIGPPSVPALFGSGKIEGGSPYLVMELIHAMTLGERMLAERGPMPPETAVRLILYILDALSAVHARGFIHRDLKPENIFVDEAKGRGVLVDFGLSKLDESEARSPEITARGAIVGTTEYMAPEQCEGRLELDARADIYAVGIILYEMLTGRPPFFGPAALVRDCHTSQRPPRPGAIREKSGLSPLPTALEDVLLRCLAKEPGDRYRDAKSLGWALIEALAASGKTRRSPRRPLERLRGSRRAPPSGGSFVS